MEKITSYKVTSISEIIEFARMVTWQLSWSEDKIRAMTTQLAKTSNLDDCLDMLDGYLGDHVHIKRD